MAWRIMAGACLGILTSIPVCNAMTRDSAHTWYLVEIADVIAVGRLEVNSKSSVAIGGHAAPMAIKLNVQEVLKGSIKLHPLALHYQTYEGSEKPLEEKLRRLNGRNVIVFLTYDSDRKQYYFYLYYSEDRIIESSLDNIRRVKDLILQEDIAVKEIHKYETANSLMEEAVRDAIKELASHDGQVREKGRDGLLHLGCAGVPFIIQQMRDYRPYPGVLRLPNRAENGFESMQQFYPKTIYAALSHILEYLTGTSFRHSEFLNTEAQRDEDYHGWVVYLAHEAGAFGPVSSPCN